jgi:c(7)-type cytochrome triheme protein
VKTRHASVRTLVLVSLIIAFFVGIGFHSPEVQVSSAAATEALSPSEGYSGTEALPAPAAQNWGRFPHGTQQHTRMPCLVCHVRQDNRAALRMPGHIPCASCHAEQFADNRHPICTICHTATSVKPFPTLRSFRTRFDHGRHSRLANCTTCHKPTSGGAAFSVPARLAGHTTCFQCHGPQATAGAKQLGSCSTCHQAGRPQRFSSGSRAYSVNFNHSEHTRKNVSCSECHTVRSGRPVTSPLVSMHFAPPRTRSCAACHDNRRAFGGEDFNDCRRCHEGSTFKF